MERIFDNETHVVFYDGKTKIKITTKQPFVPVLEFDFSGIGQEVFLAIADLVPSSRLIQQDETSQGNQEPESDKTKVPGPPKVNENQKAKP